MSYKYTLNLHFFCVRYPTKVRPFLKHNCSILSSFKIVVIFNLTSAEIKTKSADENDHNFERSDDRATVFLK